MPVSEVTSTDVLEILTPIWHAKAATARCMRERMRARDLFERRRILMEDLARYLAQGKATDSEPPQKHGLKPSSMAARSGEQWLGVAKEIPVTAWVAGLVGSSGAVVGAGRGRQRNPEWQRRKE